MKTLHKIFQLVRPSQQLKTGAVVLGALASGKVESVDSVCRLGILTILWIGLATAVYIINDLTDLDLDRLHPKKSKRPIASGLVSKTFASATLIVLLLVNAIVFPLLGLNVAMCALIYLLLNIAYSAKLKNFVVIDILIVCAGFGAAGFGMGPFFPAFNLAAASIPGIAPSVGLARVGLIAIAAYFGGPTLVGLIAEVTSLPVAFAFPVILYLIAGVQSKYVKVRALKQ
jgi:4-hydroxybenzoate polyprenyltransferase